MHPLLDDHDWAHQSVAARDVLDRLVSVATRDGTDDGDVHGVDEICVEEGADGRHATAEADVLAVRSLPLEARCRISCGSACPESAAVGVDEDGCAG